MKLQESRLVQEGDARSELVVDKSSRQRSLFRAEQRSSGATVAVKARKKGKKDLFPCCSFA
jgi:hypothetical protein